VRHRLGRGGDANLDGNGIMQQCVCEPADVIRHRRAEQQVLPLLRKAAQDTPDVGQEPHVQHHVRLVEDEHLNGRQVDGPLGHMVEQTARARDHDVHTAPQGIDLRVDADAAVERLDRQAGLPAEPAEVARNLLRELPRRGDHQRVDGAARLLQQVLHDG